MKKDKGYSATYALKLKDRDIIPVTLREFLRAMRDYRSNEIILETIPKDEIEWFSISEVFK